MIRFTVTFLVYFVASFSLLMSTSPKQHIEQNHVQQCDQTNSGLFFFLNAGKKKRLEHTEMAPPHSANIASANSVHDKKCTKFCF